MLYLTEPTWIWVSAGIIIPVLIHLAKGPSGKTRSIGSIQFLKENILSPASGLKIREILLLMLRCLGILLTALLLSEPVWKSLFLSGTKKGWILVEKQRTVHALTPYEGMIDSLLQTGYELHLLENDFPKTQLSDRASIAADTAETALPPYWQLLKKLQELTPANMPLFVFSGNKLSRFSGNRPELSPNLQWFFTEEPDTVVKWNSEAYATPADSIRILYGNSRPKATWFYGAVLNKGAYNQIAAEEKMNPDTSDLVVAIYSAANSPDAGYVQAALKAIRDYTHHKLTFYHTENKDSIKSGADWIFWLSDSSLPARLHPKNLFVYKTGAPAPAYTWIYPAYKNEEAAISIFQIIPASVDSSSGIILSDGFGRPVLRVEEKDSRTYTFFSHFDPAWNDLPWSSSFPGFFLNLLYPEKLSEKDLWHDFRRMAPAQARAVILSPGNKISGNKYLYTDLSRLCWGLLFLVFFLERFLSWKKKEVSHA